MNRLTAVLAVSLTLGAASVGASPSMAQPITSLDTASLAPVLGNAQTAADASYAQGLPGKIAGQLDLSSLRMMGHDEDGTYSTSLDNSGRQVCVIAQMTSKIGSIHMDCETKDVFARRALSLGLQENLGTSTATTFVYAFPADVDISPLAAPLNGGAADHVIIEHGTDRLPQKAELNRKDSPVKFEFETLGPLRH